LSSDETIDGSLAIAAVSDKLGIPIPTIRSWERRYGFPTPSRTPGKHRRYTRTEIDDLRAVRDAITQGHPASVAVTLVRDGAPTAPPRREEVEALLGAGMRLDPNAARIVLHDATESVGAERAIVEVALPALQEVGSRWKTGTCDVANEHLLTDSIRSWLARLSTMARPPGRPPTAVLCCGPKELHSVGLEAFGAMLTRRGWSIVQLGPLTPVDALVSSVVETRARVAVVVAQRSVNRRSTLASIEAVDRLNGTDTFYAGGAFSSASSRRGVPGTYLGSDLIEAAGVVEAVISSELGRGRLGDRGRVSRGT